MSLTIVSVNKRLKQIDNSLSLRFVNGRFAFIQEDDFSFNWLKTFSSFEEARSFLEREVF